MPGAGGLVRGVAGRRKPGKEWPLLRHVWPTFAWAATAWRVAKAAMSWARWAGVEARSRKPAAARAGRAREGGGRC